MRALDNYLSIPMLMLEKPLSASKRRRKYGLLGDFRLKDHGGFEYRTPASWLISQEIALGVLSLSMLIAESYPLLQESYLSSAEAQCAYYRCNKDFFRPMIQSIWSKITQCPAYLVYKNALSTLEHMVLNGDTWVEASDFRNNWKVTIPKNICKKL